MAERKWEKVDMTLTSDERRSFRSALIVFAILEALGLIIYASYKILR